MCSWFYLLHPPVLELGGRAVCRSPLLLAAAPHPLPKMLSPPRCGGDMKPKPRAGDAVSQRGPGRYREWEEWRAEPPPTHTKLMEHYTPRLVQLALFPQATERHRTGLRTSSHESLLAPGFQLLLHPFPSCRAEV